jgi:hypothetical protein
MNARFVIGRKFSSMPLCANSNIIVFSHRMPSRQGISLLVLSTEIIDLKLSIAENDESHLLDKKLMVGKELLREAMIEIMTIVAKKTLK